MVTIINYRDVQRITVNVCILFVWRGSLRLRFANVLIWIYVSLGLRATRISKLIGYYITLGKYLNVHSHEYKVEIFSLRKAILQ